MFATSMISPLKFNSSPTEKLPGQPNRKQRILFPPFFRAKLAGKNFRGVVLLLRIRGDQVQPFLGLHIFFSPTIIGSGNGESY